MKHAYLILAHTEFELLALLVQALDDERNDIYIHFDKKVKHLPEIRTKRARLTYLKERLDIRWGHSSMMQAEFKLLETASSFGDYAYLHLLSGVDLPLKSQDYIHDFFAKNKGKEFVAFYNGSGGDTSSLEHKVQRRHIFSDAFKGSGLAFKLKRILRFLFLRMQILAGLKRNEGIEFKKGGQWFSITSDFAKYLLAHQEECNYIYSDSFCCDELFVQTLLWHSPFAPNIYDQEDEGRGAMRYIGWQDNQLLDFTSKDLDALKKSEALFARKFNAKDPSFLSEVLSLSK